MMPTTKLRFVERDVIVAHGNGGTFTQTVRVLQQWWAIERAGQITPEGKWMDVPLEKEND